MEKISSYTFRIRCLIIDECIFFYLTSEKERKYKMKIIINLLFLNYVPLS